jgi:hypothetical protein
MSEILTHASKEVIEAPGSLLPTTRHLCVDEILQARGVWRVGTQIVSQQDIAAEYQDIGATGIGDGDVFEL